MDLKKIMIMFICWGGDDGRVGYRMGGFYWGRWGIREVLDFGKGNVGLFFGILVVLVEFDFFRW
jgi:hypothetical protein